MSSLLSVYGDYFCDVGKLESGIHPPDIMNKIVTSYHPGEIFLAAGVLPDDKIPVLGSTVSLEDYMRTTFMNDGWACRSFLPCYVPKRHLESLGAWDEWIMLVAGMKPLGFKPVIVFRNTRAEREGADAYLSDIRLLFLDGYEYRISGDAR